MRIEHVLQSRHLKIEILKCCKILTRRCTRLQTRQGWRSLTQEWADMFCIVCAQYCIQSGKGIPGRLGDIVEQQLREHGAHHDLPKLR